eukprot:Skav228118  [mRNA]  locus=scaffold1220:126416:129291:+ [translate_table: standard]
MPSKWPRLNRDMNTLSFVVRACRTSAKGSVCVVKQGGLQLNASVQPSHSEKPGQIQPESVHAFESRIRSIVLSLLGEAPSMLDLDADLNDELGLDSLGGAELPRLLSKEFGIKLPAAVLAEAPTVNALQLLIRKELTRRWRSAPNHRVIDATTLVVGAGVGGIAFAQHLVNLGEKVIVMEKSPTPGGSWSLGNDSSQLQIDSPSYMLNYDVPSPWKTTYPGKLQVMDQVTSIAQSLPDLRLQHSVHGVAKVAQGGCCPSRVPNPHKRGKYQVKYTDESSRDKEIQVDSVAFFLGGEDKFQSVSNFIGLGHGNDLSPSAFEDKDVVIVGHGAFAIENVRAALQHQARSVTIVARRRNVVFPTVVNWLINAVDKTLSIRSIRPILAKFYAAAGLSLDDLPALRGDSIDFRIPACSDIYFLAQARVLCRCGMTF